MGTRSIISVLLIALCCPLYGQTVNFPTAVSPQPGGSTGQVQYKNSSSPGGASSLTTNGTNLALAQTSAVPSPSSGTMHLLAAAVGNYALPAVKEQNGPLRYIQGNSNQHRFEWIPFGYGNTTTSLISGTVATSGTATATTFSTSAPPYTTARTLSYVSSTGANAFAGVKCFSTNFIVAGSSPTNGGGFRCTIRFAVPFSASASSAFVGMSTGITIPAGGTSGANITNFLGMGYAVSDANYSILYNDGSGSPNAISLGSNFPTGTTSQGYYELVLYNNTGTSGFDYRVTNLQTGNTANGRVTTTDLPSAFVTVSPVALVTNLTSGQAAVINIGIINAEGY